MSAKLKIVPSPAASQPQTWFERDNKGAIVFTGQSYEDHVAAWDDAQIQVDSGQWGQAQIVASLVTKYNESTVKRFAHDVKRSAQYIWDMASTYRAFPEKSVRTDYLSFTHHLLAARADEPKDAIEKARDKEWSTRELKSYVEAGVEPEPKAKGSRPKLPPELKKIYDRACREHLDASILAIRKQAEAPPDPLFPAVYRKCVEILEWQRDRSLEGDCMTIMRVFAGEEGSEASEVAGDDYVAAWLNNRGFIMGDDELGHGGCATRCPSKHDHLQPIGYLGLLVRLKLLVVQSREKSRGPTQRGSIPTVYCADPGYFEALDRISTNPHGSDRLAAIHKDWIGRLKLYAPELLPKKTKAA